MDAINHILVVGGTHGNETSGLALIHNVTRTALTQQYTSLNLDFEVGNPAAVAANVRFTEEDLNRQFTLSKLSSPESHYEAQRANQLNQKWGPKGDSRTDLIIDIHNTTSAMDATLIILELDEFHSGLARYVSHHMPKARILVEDEKAPLDHPYLCTLGKRGVMVEVGAQPQGVYRADITQLAMDLTRHILDYCTLVNSGHFDSDKLPTAQGFRLGETVMYPQSSGQQREWMIHGDLQDRDYELLKTGDPVFISFSGQVKTWQGEDTYPHFVNEAAYHQQNVAFATACQIWI